MRPAIRLGIAAFLLFVIRSAFAQCDVARGTVKAGNDADVHFVDAAAPLPVTIASLHEIAAPRPLPQSSRVAPVETTVYSVTATLAGLEVETDSSYRLILSDDAGRTMLAALPPPVCVAGSPFAAEMLAARAALDAGFRSGVTVEVHGLGFFGFVQGQPGAAPNGIELHPITSIDFAPIATAAPTARHRAVVGTNPKPACPLPTVTLQFSRSSVCPGESVTLTWQASDPKATVSIGGVGANLPASGSTVVGTTTSLAYSARATSSCGVGPETVAVLDVQQGASASIGASPSSIQQNASATITVTTANAASWSVSSSLGNPLSPSSGTASGTVSIAYTGSRSGTDTILLTATGRACGAIQRSASIAVNSSTPPPPPPPTGFLRCCDGTTSPTCTSCANKQGCCSSHKGVCGCP